MKRILIFVEAFYPGYRAGGPTRSIINLVNLLSQSYDIYVVCKNKDVKQEDTYEGVDFDQWVKSELLGCSILYQTDAKRSLGSVIRIIRDVSPDFIFLNSLWNVKYSIVPLFAAFALRIVGNVVLNPRGELNEGALKIKPIKKKIGLAFLKLTGILKSITWNATNEVEKRRIEYFFGSNTKIKIAPNVPRNPDARILGVDKNPGECRLIFLSRISRIKRLDYLIEVLKLVKINVSLSIYGPLSDKEYWEECLKVIDGLPTNISVYYGGEVKPQDVLKVISENHLFVLPTEGENFGHAIFDSFLAGVPVLISDQTPWRNLEKEGAGYDLSLGTKKHWIDVITQFCAIGNDTFKDYRKSTQAYARNFLINSEIEKKQHSLFSREN